MWSNPWIGLARITPSYYKSSPDLLLLIELLIGSMPSARSSDLTSLPFLLIQDPYTFYTSVIGLRIPIRAFL